MTWSEPLIRTTFLFLIAPALVSCSSADPTATPDLARDAVASQDLLASDRSPNVDLPAGTVVDSGPLYLDSCKNFPGSCQGSTDPHCGKCGYRMRYNSSHCTAAKPCDDLLLIWAHHGCQSQTMGQVMGKIAATNSGLVVACAEVIHPGEILPISLGAPERETALMTHLLGLLKPGGSPGVWSGKNMLMGGCSQGATRYPLVAARYSSDSNWLGSAKTAVCMSDGVYSIPFQDSFIGQDLAGSSCQGRHRRIAQAYTLKSPSSTHSCSASPKGQCACDPAHASIKYPGDCGDGDCVTFDSIMVSKGAGFAFSSGITAASFAVKNWKLISEGDAFRATSNRCGKDVCPRGPLKGLCAALDAAASHSCTFVDRPNDAHCAHYWANISTLCVEWFRKL